MANGPCSSHSCLCNEAHKHPKGGVRTAPGLVSSGDEGGEPGGERGSSAPPSPRPAPRIACTGCCRVPFFYNKLVIWKVYA